MKVCNKIVIIGLGLIGASLGIALKRRKAAHEIVGVSRKDSTLKIAKAKRAVDWCAKDVKRAVRDADIIILATPVYTIRDFASQLSKLISKKCIISDVGSSKTEIVNAFEAKGMNFVGAHPLAGSEKKGAKFADGLLFKNSLCILTPTKKTNKGSLAKIKELWQLAGARTVDLSPHRHDAIISSVSHLPHVIAFSLAQTLSHGASKFVPSSFKDLTRIASSDPEIWIDIFLSNRKFLLRDIDRFQRQINSLKSLIKGRDSVNLFKSLKRANLKISKI